MKGAMAGTLTRGKMQAQRRKSHMGEVKPKYMTGEDIQVVSNFWSGVRCIATLQKNPTVKNSKIKSFFARHTSSEVERGSSKQAFAFHTRELNRGHVIPLFDPDGQIKLLWDSFVGLLIFYSVTIIPFRIGFQRDSSPLGVLIDSVVDCCFFLDICACFNTTFVERTTELIVTDRKLIAIQYLKLWFWIDFFSTIPIDRIIGFFMGGGDDLAALGLIRILRLTRLLKLLRVLKLSKFGKFIEEFNINPALLGVQKLVVQICFVAHIIACFWYFLSTSDVVGYDDDYSPGGDYREDTWAKTFGFVDVSIGDKYVASFYWTISTMLSIGYGDIYATNSIERIYAIITQLLGAVMFGAVIAQVTRLIESRNPQAKAFKEKMDELKAYLNEKLLPNKLKHQAKKSYGFFLQKKSAFAESSIFQDLPPNLLHKLVTNIYSEDIMRINLFRSYTDEGFIVKVVTASKPFQAGPGILIMEKGDVPDEICFITRGLVQFSTTDGIVDAISGYSTDGGYFGDFEYYKKTTRLVSHQAMLNCNLLSVSTTVFDDAIAQYPALGDKLVEEFQKRYKNFITVSKSSKVLKETETSSGQIMKKWFKTTLLVDGSLQEDNEQHEMSLKRTTVFKAGISKRKKRISHVEMHRTTRKNLTNFGKSDEEIVEESAADIHKRFLILPKDDNKVKWDMFIGVLIMYSVLVIPVQIGFGRKSMGGMKIFDYCVDIFFFLDMVVSCRTCYFDDESESYVTIPSKIYKNYFFTWFAVDFFSVVPLDLMFGGAGGSMGTIFRSFKLIKVIRLLRLLKLARLAKLRKYITRMEDSLGINPATFELAKMILEVLFIGHITACLYWYLSAVMTTRTWFDLLDLRNAGLKEQYITTIYWTFTTLATVGYGDITPINTSERIVTVVVMILGATVFGYIVANVSTLMGSLDVTSTRTNERISEVTEYLNEKNAPAQLSDAIIKHVKYMFTQASAFDERGILSRLPNYITRRMILYQHSETLGKIAIFKYIESKGVILYLFRRLQPVFYDVDHFIVYENSLATDISFLVSGKCDVYRSKIRTRKITRDTRRSRGIATSKGLKTIPLELCDKIGTLEPGDMFGHLSMMKKAPLTASVRTFLPSSVYNLPETEIMRLIHEFPQVAISVQNALGCVINNRRKIGRRRYKSDRAQFIAEIRKSFLTKRAHSLGEENKKRKSMKKKRISSIISRSISIGGVSDSQKDRIKAPPPMIESKRSYNRFNLSSKDPTKVVPIDDASSSTNASNIEEHKEMISRLSVDIDAAMKSRVRTYSEVSVDSTGDSPTHASLKKGNGSVIQNRAQRRWAMIRRVIRDPVLMALLKQSEPEETVVAEPPVQTNSKKKLIYKLIPRIPSKKSQDKYSEGEVSVSERPAEDFSKKSQTMGDIAMKGLKEKKVGRINLVGPDNEMYDSEDDMMQSDEYRLKKSAMLMKSIECPYFTNRTIYNRPHKATRRMSFPSYELQDWKDRKKYTHHL